MLETRIRRALSRRAAHPTPSSGRVQSDANGHERAKDEVANETEGEAHPVDLEKIAAMEPMPSVSKKFVTNPVASSGAVGTTSLPAARFFAVARDNMTMKYSVTTARAASSATFGCIRILARETYCH
jgi:hypothetical protein